MVPGVCRLRMVMVAAYNYNNVAEQMRPVLGKTGCFKCNCRALV